MAFSHPVPELHAQILDGRFGLALDEALESAYGEGIGRVTARTDFETFEAQYIELFEVGHKGRPAVPLCAGEYIDLLDGKPRPAFLLQYARFYRHFGVRARDAGEDNELPDHITCQLEFMAWLTHLEAEALDHGKQASAYQRAQRDFTVKLMTGFCHGMSRRLETQCQRRTCDPVFGALGATLNHFVQRNRMELESVHGAVGTSDTAQPRRAPSAQNLWG